MQDVRAKSIKMFKYIIIGLLLASNVYPYCTPSKERPFEFHRTMDTIGDSLTWGAEGIKLRCLLRDAKFEYDFTGYYLDPYGFRHDGHGGDSTDDVVSRMSTIPISDNYFLLIGVNDIRLTDPSALYTFTNINRIAYLLHQKNSHARIYISTLLPASKGWPGYNERNNQVNELLRNELNCKNCKLIDTGKYFASIPNWYQLTIDGLHPNEIGYKLIANYLKDNIN